MQALSFSHSVVPIYQPPCFPSGCGRLSNPLKAGTTNKLFLSKLLWPFALLGMSCPSNWEATKTSHWLACPSHKGAHHNLFFTQYWGLKLRGLRVCASAQHARPSAFCQTPFLDFNASGPHKSSFDSGTWAPASATLV